MPLITLDNISVRFSQKSVLDEISTTIHNNEKIALIGRNGEGKTTLMRLLAGVIDADDGLLHRKNNTTISYLQQTPPKGSNEKLFDIVAKGLGVKGDLLVNYQNALTNNMLDEAAKIQQKIDDNNAWDLIPIINSALEKFELNPEHTLEQLSGGWRRRVMLAKAMIAKPSILLLDEPTNHMDITAILGLEKQLQNYVGTIILISHDREFVANVCHKVFDLDRGKLSVFDCGYHEYIKRKDEQLNALMLEQKRFDKKLAQEEVWIRQGIKARRTRNEGRVRALKKMRLELSNRRAIRGKAKIQTLDKEMVSKIIFEIEKISYSIGNLNLVNEFSSLILKGDKIGIIGGNGVGKSTFIKLLLGELKQTQGKIKRSKNCQIAYFDQTHEQLNLEQKAMDFVSGGRERIDIGGKSKHIIGYLRNFLFTAEQCRSPIKMLSGGEKNRLLLAKILSQESNLLVLDEPTNDLDVETLELLEEMLSDYKGTLLLISHDRKFINNVVTSTIVFEGNGIIEYYVGNYDDYLLQKKETITQKIQKTSTPKQQTFSKTKPKVNSDKLLSKIDDYENKIKAIHLVMADEDFYKQEQNKIDKTLNDLKETEEKLNQAYKNWELLEC
ncbi:COG0488: ATPase components of ABC transporters with duplicated ATPase domains [hydrothermal vent metagenome]|uniref:COG0488: ATPase components of ABC transporters with duplicated ATPase domains n=1 Tax=hydrothermal vent metagenome TaxID=652676 RepID=A0A1W1CMC3_9ZZZZ